MIGHQFDKKENRINRLEKMNINGSEQWVLIKGENADAPLLIHVQGGPGLPMIPEADSLYKLLRLEDDYSVAYWDQRGCGKSFHKNLDPKTLTLTQLADDVIACTKYLLNRYQKKQAALVGYSVGATLSLMAAYKQSNLFNRIFLVGMDVDIPAANRHAFQFGLRKAKETHNKKAERMILPFENAPVVDIKTFQRRVKIMADLGGIQTGATYNKLFFSTVKNILASRAYSLADVFRFMQGMAVCQKTLLPEMDRINLFEHIDTIDFPVHFIQGKRDGVASSEIAWKYYEYLKTTKKTFSTFENSAHMPHYEEPDKFAELIRQTYAGRE